MGTGGNHGRIESAPIFYIAVAGDVPSTLERWAAGEEDERCLAVTYTSQFFSLCNRLSRRGIVSFPGIRGQRLLAGGMEAAPRPPSETRSGIAFHLQRVSNGLSLVLRIVKSGARDVILMDGVTYFVCLLPARIFGIRLYASFHTELYDPRAPLSRVQRLIWAVEGWALRRFYSGCMAVSPVVAAQIRKVARSPAVPIHRFHGTYSPALFESARVKIPSARKFNLFFGGRIERKKGVFDLVEIVDRLTRSGFEVDADVCGSGACLRELQEEIDRRQLGRRIRLHGACSRGDMLRYLEACDAVIVPTRSEFREGLNKALVEGISSCRPAVTSDICLRGAELGEAAVEAVADDPDSYAQAVQRLIEDPALYRSKAVAASRLRSRFVDEEASWFKNALRMFANEPPIEARTEAITAEG